MIQITEPFLPPLDEYVQRLQEVWDRNWLTNDGPLVRELEDRLRDYLDVEHVLLVANGTLALQIAFRAVGLEGEVITTPFSHIATTASLVWEGCQPRFVDVDPHSWNLDAEQIDAAVTSRTRGIVATHVYGNPCDVDGIAAAARDHGLRVVYDGAHCFGTRWRGRSILEQGDATAISFHATKLFHTVEGGAVVTRSADLHRRMAYMRNFGHDGPAKFNGVGINAKATEVHAAMGLCNLAYVDGILAKRRSDTGLYDAGLRGLALARPRVHADAEPNGAYYPVLFPSEEVLLAAVDALEARGLVPRRYFYPALSELDYVEHADVPVAKDVSGRVLCLPLSFQIREDEIGTVCGVLREVVGATC